MTAYLVLTLLFIAFVGAVVVSILDPKPMRRPPEWTVGALMDRHR